MELGCGNGQDAVALASDGHNVTAIDFSENVIERNIKNFKDISNVKWKVGDITNLNFHEGSFDVIYSHLSLHYFTDVVTRKIVSDCLRILKKGGVLCFVCKSTKDPLFGRGKCVEKDMYDLDGHVRHFFTEEYCKQILGKEFDIISLKRGNANFYESTSSYVKAIAQKN